jgi:hypothetical protein
VKKKIGAVIFFSAAAVTAICSIILNSIPGAVIFGALLISWTLDNKEFIEIKADSAIIQNNRTNEN